ncbi:MAG: sulfite reductase [NADPH] flavoprotein alpha-component, partial [Staphylococcus epidermidis]|nr:sulfite reductase [NADPH] flavoprotein alpha-component [Staphylococcus epidermidis]
MNLSVTNSPFTEGQAKQINELLHTLSPNQQVWLSGYLMANQQSNTSTDSVEQHNLDDNTEAMLHEKEPSVEPEARSITILYGSESGNAQGLAEIFEQRLSD